MRLNVTFCCSLIADALVRFMKKVVLRTKPVHDWLSVVPLYHFVAGICKPYQKLDANKMHRTSEWWGINAHLQDIIDAYKGQTSRFQHL